MKKLIIVSALLMASGLLAFGGCDDDKKNDPRSLLLLLLGGTKYEIGDTGPSGAGIVFYVTDGGSHGLEAATGNQSNSQAWIEGGSTQSTYNGGTSTGIGTGLANSNAIVAQEGHTGSAAQVCRSYDGGGLNDWFLPSADEWAQLYTQRDVVGGFSGFYWSSTENPEDADGASWARYWNFSDGALHGTPKNSLQKVRCIRPF